MMNGAIDASLLMELARRDGWMEQLSFDFPPMIYINPDYVKDVSIGYSWDTVSWTSSQDHPAFSKLREALGSKGYIKIERGWCNGDTVLKPFYLNQVYFEEGEQFPCAAAMSYVLKDGTYVTKLWNKDES